jgi:hypothetical protein
MKKLFLFSGVIISCLLFSCKKDTSSSQTPPPPPPPPPIDSFLLHPPSVLDSLPIPFTTGSWWKYHRVDSSLGGNPVCCVLKMIDSSIELLTVIGKAPFVVAAYEIKNNIINRTRYDTVNAFMLEMKNLTKGTLDTIYSFYYYSSLRIFNFSITVPIIEGTKKYYSPYESTNILLQNTSVNVFDKTFVNCIYNESSYSAGWPSGTNEIKNIFLKPGIGCVYSRTEEGKYSQYERASKWYVRRILDYYIAP